MGFSSELLDQYIQRHKLRPATADYVRRASRDVARDVSNNASPSVVAEFQSIKMGTSINLESRTSELAYVFELEFEPTILAYYEQPPAVDCLRQLRRGGQRLFTYHPDFLVLAESGPFVVELKTAKELANRVATRPDWELVDGRYHDRAAEEALALYALPHVVVSSATMGPILACNRSLILRAMDTSDCDERLWERVQEVTHVDPVMSLAGLAGRCDLVDLTPLIRLIAAGRLHSDLRHHLLTEDQQCMVTTRPTLLAQAVQDVWSVFLQAARSQGAAISTEVLPEARYLEVGLTRLAKLDDEVPARTRRRWRAAIRAGEARGLSALAAVSPRFHLRGRSSKRPPAVLEYAQQYIRDNAGPPATPTIPALYRGYVTAARDEHPQYRRVSRPTFQKLYEGLHPTLAGQRGGKRAANAAASPADVDDRALSAQRPFELASCDHYLTDLYCIVVEANHRVYVMRPWLTLLRDCYSQRALATWLTLGDPSRLNCALVIRECLRRHGRLPESIIVDHGADFRSVYFSELMSYCRVHLLFRPSGHPRFGSEAERFFGLYRQLWLDARPGHLLRVREVREVSGSHKPQSLASLTLRECWEDLAAFSEWIDHYTTDSKIAPPSALEAEGLARFACSGRRMPFDERFVVASAVDAGNYLVTHERGLHVGPFHYWHPALAGYSGQRLATRRDPENPFRLFAHAGKAWVRCLAPHTTRFDAQSALDQRSTNAILRAPALLRSVLDEDANCDLASIIAARDGAPREPVTQMSLRTFEPPASQSFFESLDISELNSFTTTEWT